MFLSDWIHAFAGLNVLVVGEAMLDSYLQGTADRLCQEAPVPVVNLRERQHVPGGAANAAVNLRSLGGIPHLLSVVGDDPEWALLQRALEQHGTTTEDVIVQPDRQTLAKQRVLANEQLLVRFDCGTVTAIDSTTEQQVIERLTHWFDRCEAVLISDYAYGILTPRVIETLAELQARSPRVLVVDARNLAAYRSVGATAVKPNYAEAVQLLKLNKLSAQTGGDRVAQILAQEKSLLEITGAEIAAVTLDVEGAVILQAGQPPHRTRTQPAAFTQAAGAGDTFISALALALAAQAPTAIAADLAAAAAAVVVSKPGTATCTLTELLASLSPTSSCLIELAELLARIDTYRQQGKRIVFTNGCFDILHSGHVSYLNQAKALGDVLVIGINSDASIRRLKGSDRPIQPLTDRAQVLLGLGSVDHVIAFEQDTPIALIQAIQPDIYVKGGDYTRETLPETPVVEAIGGRVEILPYLPDHSTTQIIQRIQAATLPGIEHIARTGVKHE